MSRLVESWIALTFAVNSLNRSMGLPDLYPFVLGAGIPERGFSRLGPSKITVGGSNGDVLCAVILQVRRGAHELGAPRTCGWMMRAFARG